MSFNVYAIFFINFCSILTSRLLINAKIKFINLDLLFRKWYKLLQKNCIKTIFKGNFKIKKLSLQNLKSVIRLLTSVLLNKHQIHENISWFKKPDMAIRNNIVPKKTTELVILFHKMTTKLVFLWTNYTSKC